MLYLINNFLTQDQLEDIYFKILDTRKWYLTRGSNQKELSGFCGLEIEDEHSDIFGFLVTNLRHRAKELGVNLSNKIERIHAIVKQKNAPVSFHQDTEDPNAYSFVGLLTPSWNKEWGGQFETENKKIIFEPGQFVLIKSNQLHCGYGPSVDIPYWRLVINIIMLGK